MLTYSTIITLTFIGFFSEFHRGQSQVLQGDMFLPAMRDFQAQATCRLAEAEDLFQDMKTRVSFEIIYSLSTFVSFTEISLNSSTGQ